MVLIIGLIIFELILFLCYLPYATFYWPIFFLLLYFVLWYGFDDSETTGNKTWNTMRNWSIWATGINAVSYIFGDKKRIIDPKSKRLMFVVIGNVTNMGLISGFGCHGGIFKNLDIYYTLPKILFWVPLLRECLMWTGAVADDKDIILYLLNRGRSVCCSLNGMKANPNPLVIDEELFNFAKSEDIQLIPVEVTGEEKRYTILHWKCQNIFLDLIGYPFPFCFGPKIFGDDPPPKLNLHVGVPMDTAIYKTCEEFSLVFFAQLYGCV